MEIVLVTTTVNRYPNTRPNYTLSDFNGIMQIEYIIDSFSSGTIHVILTEANEAEHSIAQYLRNNYEDIVIKVVSEKQASARDEAEHYIKNAQLNSGALVISNCTTSFDIEVKEGNYAFKNSNNEDLGICKFDSIQDFLNNTDTTNVCVCDYNDYRSLEQWVKDNDKSVIFCDIDGTIIVAQHKDQYHTEPQPLPENIKYLQEEIANGAQVIFTTARKKEFDGMTAQMLNKLGFTDFTLVSGLMNAKRILVNDYTDSVPAPRAIAVNIKRNTDTIRQNL